MNKKNVDEKYKPEEIASDDKISMDEIEEDENNNQNKKKVENAFSIAKIFRCRKCLQVSDNAELCCFSDCKHFMCVKCFKKLCLENIQKNSKIAIEKFIFNKVYYQLYDLYN